MSSTRERGVYTQFTERSTCLSTGSQNTSDSAGTGAPGAGVGVGLINVHTGTVVLVHWQSPSASQEKPAQSGREHSPVEVALSLRAKAMHVPTEATREQPTVDGSSCSGGLHSACSQMPQHSVDESATRMPHTWKRPAVM